MYADHWEALERDRLEYLTDRADEDADDQASDEAAERLEWRDAEWDAALEQWKREERASEPYFNVRPLKRARLERKVAA
ncbi:MAG: hypothetical protein HC933_03985 [Pleurocapsa sp. SU_196_0]|nr:hypothetical protein [Pleurocapsa sp. SU_196_0]